VSCFCVAAKEKKSVGRKQNIAFAVGNKARLKTLKHKEKQVFIKHFTRFRVTLAPLKLLTLGNEKKKRSFHFAFHSFYSNFAPTFCLAEQICTPKANNNNDY
jgi:hypothetical protein